MNALFVGLGSIGTRHLTNLKKLMPEIKADALRSSNRPLSQNVAELIEDEYFGPDELSKIYDLCFVTNPTHLHRQTILDTKPFVKNYFIEKPLFETPYDLPFSQEQIVYVAAPLRHTKLFITLQELIRSQKPLAARAICSSHLPDWRPDTDYTKCYSAIKEYGGGVRLDLIHEWDYLCALFGKIDSMKSMHGRFSDLKINSEDCAIYIATAGRVAISLHLDYFGRQYKRNCEIICEGGNIVADFATGIISHYEKGDLDCSEEPNSKYVRELEHFLAITKGANNINDAEHALDTLKLAISNDF